MRVYFDKRKKKISGIVIYILLTPLSIYPQKPFYDCYFLVFGLNFKELIL